MTLPVSPVKVALPENVFVAVVVPPMDSLRLYKCPFGWRWRIFSISPALAISHTCAHARALLLLPGRRSVPACHLVHTTSVRKPVHANISRYRNDSVLSY